MKALDPIKYREEIMSHLDTLIALDFTRVNYYKDLSKFLVVILVIRGEIHTHMHTYIPINTHTVTYITK